MYLFDFMALRSSISASSIGLDGLALRNWRRKTSATLTI